jgi:hypothetical protein
VIDAGLPDEWPDEVRRSTARFKQGHLVGRPPFFYVASPRHGVWDLTREAGDPALEEDILQLDEELSPPYGLITSQTCDIDEQGPPRKPWIQVVPVYDARASLPPGSEGNLQRHRIGYLHLLSGPALPEGTWIADGTAPGLVDT